MDSEAIEEAFNDHYRLVLKYGAMQTEESQRFTELRWETIPRFCGAKRSPRVSDETSAIIVNGYHNAALHVPAFGKETNPKVFRRFRTDSTLSKIEVM
jgi:hypothetical protein